jgi:hypothetical protein
MRKGKISKMVIIGVCLEFKRGSKLDIFVGPNFDSLKENGIKKNIIQTST